MHARCPVANHPPSSRPAIGSFPHKEGRKITRRTSCSPSLILGARGRGMGESPSASATHSRVRSEEHTSELQSRPHLVCRLLLEKKKKNIITKLQTNTNTTN